MTLSRAGELRSVRRLPTMAAPMMPTLEPMKRKEYEKALRALQVELCALQEWVKAKDLRIIVVFEGRDAAGKGGTIKAITERVSPCAQREGSPSRAPQSKVASGTGRLSWCWTRTAGWERGRLAPGEDLGKGGLRNAGVSARELVQV